MHWVTCLFLPWFVTLCPNSHERKPGSKEKSNGAGHGSYNFLFLEKIQPKAGAEVGLRECLTNMSGSPGFCLQHKV